MLHVQFAVEGVFDQVHEARQVDAGIRELDRWWRRRGCGGVPWVGVWVWDDAEGHAALDECRRGRNGDWMRSESCGFLAAVRGQRRRDHGFVGEKIVDERVLLPASSNA